MKRILLATAVALISLVQGVAAPYTTAAEAFTEAPQGVFLLLNRNDRLDMIDFFKAGSAAKVTNALDGKSRITAMTDKQIEVEMTPSSVYTLSLLPGGDEMALVTTLSTPSRDSRINFYSTADWKQLDSKGRFTPPSLDDWLTPAGRDNREMVEMMVPFIMAIYTLDPATGTLTVTNDLATFLTPETYAEIAEYLHPSLTYVWNGRKFVRR